MSGETTIRLVVLWREELITAAKAMMMAHKLLRSEEKCPPEIASAAVMDAFNGCMVALWDLGKPENENAAVVIGCAEMRDGGTRVTLSKDPPDGKT